MIKISVPKGEVSTQQLSALNNFENNLLDTLKTLLSQKEYQKLKVAPSLEIIPKSTYPVQIASNADYSINNSEKVRDLVTSWVKEHDELSVFLPNHTLRISLAFRIEESQETETSTKSKDLPVFTPTTPRYNLDKVILPAETKERILADLRVISHMNQVYKTWGFEEVDGIPRLVLSLYGKPGTGKTMLAHAIANHFGKKLLALNYSEIESKYVGDAAKNLKHAFDSAKELDAVLFFDEADSFLGKRIQNVSQGAEQAINSLRSQMLILLEEHQGVVLFATNLVSNFDKAFESRFLDSIEIPMPNQEARAAIIKGMIPSKLPLRLPFTEDVYMEASAIIDGLAGREIKNAILKMLLSKADQPNYQFCADDLYEAMTNKKKELDSLHQEVSIQEGKTAPGTPISGTPEQMQTLKNAIKDHIATTDVKTVHID